MTAPSKPLRERMPLVAAQIDVLRLRHGAPAVNDRLRRAKAGEAVFYAREEGAEFGCLPPELTAWASSLEEAFGGDFSLIGIQTGPDLPSISPPPSDHAVTAAGLEGRSMCLGCNGSCVGTNRRCSEQKELMALRQRPARPDELWISPSVAQPVEPINHEVDPGDPVVLEYLGRAA